MKKIVLKILVLFSAATLFAETFSFSPEFCQIFTARQVALGANYICDSSSFFSVLENPANAALTGNKNLYPFISAKMSGGLSNSYLLINAGNEGGTDGFANYLSTMDETSSTLNVCGPVCFGKIKNNFEFSFYNSIYTTSTISPTSDSSVVGGEQFLLHLAYGVPIKFKHSTLALGLGARAYTDLQGDFTGDITQAYTNITSSNMAFFPIYTSAVFGFDAGITYSINDVFVLALSWQNFFAGAISQKFDTLTNIKTFSTDYEALFNMAVDNEVIVGMGFQLPLKKCTKNFLTETNIYLQYDDLLNGIKAKDTIVGYFEPFALGCELEMFNTIIFRYGVTYDYMAAGFGIKINVIHLDVAFNSTKLGFSKNENGTIEVALSFGVYK